jgi:hypothetical protein
MGYLYNCKNKMTPYGWVIERDVSVNILESNNILLKN